ncbi:hypothetical protein, partial [Streptomyces sp. NPDC021969]|uniref:hypothetical protein n=1 Tax=Streptomyces sp. NPDC021969 TaxID=3155250 RepID=UPI0033F7E71C
CRESAPFDGFENSGFEAVSDDHLPPASRAAVIRFADHVCACGLSGGTRWNPPIGAPLWIAVFPQVNPTFRGVPASPSDHM